MEAPATLEAEDVRDEKVKVLKQIRPIAPRDCVIGQYDRHLAAILRWPNLEKVFQRMSLTSSGQKRCSAKTAGGFEGSEQLHSLPRPNGCC
eukprot:g5330.t1